MKLLIVMSAMIITLSGCKPRASDAKTSAVTSDNTAATVSFVKAVTIPKGEMFGEAAASAGEDTCALLVANTPPPGSSAKRAANAVQLAANQDHYITLINFAARPRPLVKFWVTDAKQEVRLPFIINVKFAEAHMTETMRKADIFYDFTTLSNKFHAADLAELPKLSPAQEQRRVAAVADLHNVLRKNCAELITKKP